MEGEPDEAALSHLRRGLEIQGRTTLPARVRSIGDPGVPERDPPIRFRRAIPTRWLELQLREGRNRQVRRMTAAVGLPTLRLIRVAIDLMDGGPLVTLDGLAPGAWRDIDEAEAERFAKLRQRRGRADPGFSR